MDRELAQMIVGQWVDNGMTRKDAENLFKEIATFKSEYRPPVPEEVEAPAEPVNPYTTELKYLESLTPNELKRHFLTQSLREEEAWLAWMVANHREMGHTIAEIRKQRERVQWEKKRLKTMQQHVEPSQSLDNSKT